MRVQEGARVCRLGAIDTRLVRELAALANMSCRGRPVSGHDLEYGEVVARDRQLTLVPALECKPARLLETRTRLRELPRPEELESAHDRRRPVDANVIAEPLQRQGVFDELAPERESRGELHVGQRGERLHADSRLQTFRELYRSARVLEGFREVVGEDRHP